MNVDFNNLRKQAVYSYDRLCKALNEAILKPGSDQYGQPNDANHMMILDGYVLVDAETIQKDMDDLRTLIGSIASVYEPDDEKFADVLPVDREMESFNDTDHD